MIGIIKNWIDESYEKGFHAGVMAQKVQDREDQNRRLEEMLRYGKQIGYEMAMAEIGEITIDDLGEALEGEGA